MYMYGTPDVKPTTLVGTTLPWSSTRSLYKGEHSPANPVIEALDTVEELNAFVGLAREQCAQGGQQFIGDFLEQVQNWLMEVSYHVAHPLTTCPPEILDTLEFSENTVREVEIKADECYAQLPRLTRFILLGGSPVASTLHVCRTISRRAERNTVLLLEHNDLMETVYKFLNRLSDFFYCGARYCAMLAGAEEKTYKKKALVFYCINANYCMKLREISL